MGIRVKEEVVAVVVLVERGTVEIMLVVVMEAEGIGPMVEEEEVEEFEEVERMVEEDYCDIPHHRFCSRVGST